MIDTTKMPQVDVVVLAQAFMARAAATLADAERTVPILSSPELAVASAQRALQSL